MIASGVNHISSGTVASEGNISLTPAEIHLWLAFSDEITEERLDSAYRELLNEVEKEQELRFHFPSDQRRYLITRALVRTVLSRYVSIHPKEWVFTANAYGRPEIVNLQAKEVCLDFNIAHTHGLIVLGVTKRRALGVDVENFRARDVSIDIADRYFAPQEIAVLTAAPPDQRKYRFFEYWTFKEAYIKARGMGLSLPLDKISFHYPDDRGVEITIDPKLADDSARWQFWQFRPGAEYLVAICAERVDAQSPRLIVRRVIPTLSENRFAHKVLRASA
jgi:4'-phosphopantetheinyl transferase